MPRADDCTLSPDDYKAIREQADRLLREADAYGRYPTPVPEIIATAKLSVEREASLDSGFLGRVYAQARGQIKRAVDKVLGLFHSRDRMIYLDLTLKKEKQRFVSLHETGHGYLPWQKDAYAFMEDGKASLHPETEEEFERQASVFASEILFQMNRFQEEARSLPFEIKSAMALARKFGASNYASLRRFVTESHRVCALLIFEQPIYEIGCGYTYRLRRFCSHLPPSSFRSTSVGSNGLMSSIRRMPSPHGFRCAGSRGSSRIDAGSILRLIIFQKNSTWKPLTALTKCLPYCFPKVN